MTLWRSLPALVARLRARWGAVGLFSWSRRRRAEQDVQKELDLHLELETQQNIAQGMSPEDALRAARAALGSVPLIREDVRAAWRWRWLDQLAQDVRCGARTLRRSAGFTAMSAATLALTIGATTAIFSVVHGILLRPLPVAEPERLFRVLEWPWADLRTAVSSDYLNTLGVSMVAGRPFTEDDVAGAQRVVLVSERLAEAWWPGTSAVGRRIRFPGSENEADPWRRVVGVVADVRWQGPASEGTTLYLPLAQHIGAIDEMSLVVQSSADSRLITESLQAVVAALDPETPVSRIRVMDDILARTVSRPRFTTLLVLGFAVLGVVLGMVGVYGVVAYAAARQRRDIGIRLALGATRARIRARFVRRALLFAGAGVVVGELAAAVLMSSLASLLFGVSPWDPFTYAAAPALFVMLAGLAAYVPARRATGVDPALVLRGE